MRNDKLHAVVARSTFPSRNAQNTSFSDHFWKLHMSKKCMLVWREARFQVKTYKAHPVRIALLHEVDMVRSKFASQNADKAHSGSEHFWKLTCGKSARRCGAKHISKSEMYKAHQVLEHFWKLTCGKSARRCGAKHISKSKCTKHTRFGALLEVDMWKKVHAVVARRTFPSQNVTKHTRAPDHFWKLKHVEKVARALWCEAH